MNDWDDCLQTALINARNVTRTTLEDEEGQLSFEGVRHIWMKNFRHWYREEIAEEMPAEMPENHHDVAENRAMVYFADDLLPYWTDHLESPDDY